MGKRSPQLVVLDVPTPCPEKWEAMHGDGSVRDCQSCQTPIHNISQMSEEEALEVAQATERRCIVVEFDQGGQILSRAPRRVGAGVAFALAAPVALTGWYVSDALLESEDVAVRVTEEGTKVACGIKISPHLVRTSRLRRERNEANRREAAAQAAIERSDAVLSSLLAQVEKTDRPSLPWSWARLGAFLFAMLGLVVPRGASRRFDEKLDAWSVPSVSTFGGLALIGAGVGLAPVVAGSLLLAWGLLSGRRLRSQRPRIGT